MGASCNLDELDELFFDYITRANPKSNDDLKRYLRRYPQFREAIIEFTATWRALSIVEKVLPPASADPVIERRLLRRAQARYSAIRRSRARAKTT